MTKVDFNFIKEVFNSALELEGHDLKLDSRFEEVPDWDSLGHMRLILELEQRLNISFEIDEIVGVDTVEKILSLTQSKFENS